MARLVFSALVLFSAANVICGCIVTWGHETHHAGPDGTRVTVRPVQEAATWYREVEGKRSTISFVHATDDAIYTLASTSEFLLMKWDLQGNEIWRKTTINLPLSSTSFFTSFTSLWGSDGMIFICGYIGSQVLVNNSFLAAFDASGNITWVSTWNTNIHGFPGDLWCDNTSIYVVGRTLSKWDRAGHLQWHQALGEPGDLSGTSVWGDGTSIYVVGYTANHYFISKYNSTGGLLWSKTCEGTSWSFGKGIFGTNTGIYSLSFSRSTDTQYLMKWSANGDLIWRRSISTRWSASIWSDGTCVYITGTVPENGNDVFLAKYDASGIQLYQRTWGSRSEDMGFSICGNAEAIFTGGYVASPFAYRTNALLIRWSFDGNTMPYSGFEPDFIPYALLSVNIGFLVYLGLVLRLKASSKHYHLFHVPREKEKWLLLLQEVQLGTLSLGTGLVAFSDSIGVFILNSVFNVFQGVGLILSFMSAAVFGIIAMVLSQKSEKVQERDGMGSIGGCLGLIALISACIVAYLAIIF